MRDREAVLITRNAPNDVRAELLRRHCRLCARLTAGKMLNDLDYENVDYADPKN